jgi:excisionase family DNA binding protein
MRGTVLYGFLWWSSLGGPRVLTMATSSYLLLNEAAELARVSIETVRFWIKTNRLASSRPGRRRLVRRDVLEAFLERGSTVEQKAGGHVE